MRSCSGTSPPRSTLIVGSVAAILAPPPPFLYALQCLFNNDTTYISLPPSLFQSRSAMSKSQLHRLNSKVHPMKLSKILSSHWVAWENIYTLYSALLHQHNCAALERLRTGCDGTNSNHHCLYENGVYSTFRPRRTT